MYDSGSFNRQRKLQGAASIPAHMHFCSYNVLTGLRHKEIGLGTNPGTAKGQQKGLHSLPPPVFKVQPGHSIARLLLKELSA